MTNATTTPIAQQVEEFNTGFTAQIGPDLSAVFAAEQADLVQGGVPSGVVQPGDRVPDADLVDAHGGATTLGRVVTGRTVLVFYRGAWCPFCNLTLRAYQRDLLPALTERGVRLAAISPQIPEVADRQAVDAGLEFPVLTDPGNVLARALGIRTEPSAAAREAHTALGFDVADSNADATGDVPFPTVLIVDGDRVVEFANVHVDYTTRTEVAEILGALDSRSQR